MRTRLGAVAALVVVACMIGSPVPASADPEKASAKCTLIGTPGDDVLRGTKHDDFICGLGGDDKILGLGGDDVLQGGGGDDLLVGGPGTDVLGGGRGDDTLDGLDNATAVDRLRCGRGDDTAKADPPDTPRPKCEHVEQDDAPTDVTLSPSSVPENRATGTAVGTLGATDPDVGDAHTFALVPGAGSADNGSFTIVGTQLRTAASFDHETTPTKSVRVRATDSGGLSLEKTFTVTVSDADDPPAAFADAKTVAEDAAATAIDVLANDTDIDGGPKTVQSVTQPTHGTVVIQTGGTGVTYAPAANYCNTPPPADDFTYTLNGGDSATVHVTVTCVDDPAAANDDSTTVAEDSGATAINVLANDSDVEGDLFSVTGASQATHGTTTFSANGVTYTPNANYCNTPPPFDTFTYTVTGGDTATVSVTVTCVNDAPVAVDDTKTGTEDTPLTFPAGDLTGNDTDIDGDPLTVTAVSGNVGGTATLSAGSITFTPTANLCAPASAGFDYTVSDGHSGVDTGHVTLDIVCVNDVPVANDDTRTVLEDAAATTVNVLGNDTDTESDPITVTAAAQPSHGTTTFTAANVSYKPAADYCGADSFTYTINGGASATVSVTVTCVNDAPVVDLDTTNPGHDSSTTFLETDPHAGTGVQVAPNALVSDVDDSSIESLTVVLTNRPDGDAVESLSATIPAGSGITGGTYDEATGTLTFTGPATEADFTALVQSIRYDNTKALPSSVDRIINVTANDGDLDSASSTATVQVVPLNAPPVNTVPGAQTTNEDTSLVFGAGKVISVTDPDNATLNSDVTVTHGTFTLSGTAGLAVTGNGTNHVTLSGSLADLDAALDGSTYAPSADYNGPALLTITSSDSLAASDTDTVAITVTAVNDAPTATNLSAAESFTEDTSLNLVDIVVSDVDNATVTATLTLSNPAAGSLSVATSGSVTSTYNAGTGVWAASGAIADVNTLLAGVTYLPAANFNAGFTIATSVDDGLAAPVTGSKSMTGIAVNDAPVAVADSGAAFTVAENGTAPLDPRANDTDVDNTTSSLLLDQVNATDVTGVGQTFTSAKGATITIAAGQTVTYDPGTHFDSLQTGQSDTDTFTYRVRDLGGLTSNTVTVTVTITGANDTPAAQNVAFNGAANTVFELDSTPGDPAPKVQVAGTLITGATDPDDPFGSLSVTGETVSSTGFPGGNNVVIAADGSFTYLSEPGESAPTDTFTFHVTDPHGATGTGTVTINLKDRIWYVDKDFAGASTGTSRAPFTSASTPTSTAAAGDRIYVLGRAGLTPAGATLKANQQLIGQGEALTVALGAGTPSGTYTILAAGSRPTLNSSAADVVTLASGSQVRSLNIDPQGAHRGVFGANGGGSTITDVAVNDTGTAGTLPGVELNGSSGTFSLSNVDVTTESATGVRLVNAGTVNSDNLSTINAKGGPALDASGTAGTLSLGTLSSSGSLTNGISLGGALNLNASAGSITTAAGDDINLAAGSGNVTYGGSDTNIAGHSVTVTGRTGTVALSGAVSDTGTGISLTSNSGGSIAFTGPITASTGSSAAFTATGGGTVTATDTTSTLATTTGTALNVANTTIGAGGLHFLKIAANGAPNGIVLNNTGSTAGLTVSGTGSAGTGGVIQGTSGDAISLTSTRDVDLSWMSLTNAAGNGILGSGVTGLKLTSTSITGSGDASNEDGIRIANLLGTNAWTSLSVTGSERNNVFIDNTSGTLSSLTVTGASHFDSVGAAFGANGFLVNVHGTATLTTGSIDGATFSNNKPARGLTVQAQDTATIGSFTVQNGTFANDGLGASFEQAHSANHTFSFLNNTVTGSAPSHAINVASSATSTGGTLTGKITGNTVGTAGVLDSGSSAGSGIRVFGQGGTQLVMNVSNNVIREVPNGRGIELTALGTTSGGGGARYRVANNTIAAPSGTSQSVCGPANTPCPLASIFVTSDSFGVSESLCSVVTGNTAYVPTSFALGGEAAYTLGETADVGHTSSHQTEGNVLANNTVTGPGSPQAQVDAGVSVVAAGTCGSFP